MSSGGRTFKNWLLVIALAHGASARAATAPQALSLGGQLFAADGGPILSAAVNFRIQVLDSTETCVLFSEEHLGENLSNSAGHFNLILGTGTSVVNNVGAPGVLDGKVFANGGSTPVANCASSPMTLAAGQSRQIHVLYDLGQGYVALTPAVPVVSSAYALVADSLGGLGTTDFVQVNGTSALSQANQEYAFSLTNWPRLKALLDGTSAQYLPSTPTMPLDVNGQRITDVHDPTAAQDAATKHYADSMLGGSALDLTAVGPSLGAGSTLQWDSTANKWVAGTLSTAPTGPAGGALAGTYPNPTLANDVVKSTNVSSAGIAVNRLIITNQTDGTTLGYGACTVVGQIYAWTTAGWVCTAVSALSPVTSVAGKTGAVTLNAVDVGGLGTAALSDWGTAANQILRLDTLARLPAVDGSQLANINAFALRSRTIASTAPVGGQVLGWNAGTSVWEPTSVVTSSGTLTSVAGGVGLLGGPITTSGTFSVDVGTAANKIVQENANAQIAQGSGSVAWPSYSFAGSLGTGLASAGTSQLALVTAGSTAMTITANGKIGIGTGAPSESIVVYNGNILNSYGSITANNVYGTVSIGQATPVAGVAGSGAYLSSSSTISWSSDQYNHTYFNNVSLGKDAAGVLYQRSGAGAQAQGYRLYNAYTDAANYERAMLDWTGVSNVLRIGTEAAGTGVVRNLALVGGSVGVGTTAPLAALDVTSVGSSSALIVPRDTTGNRPTGVNGMIRYNTTTNALESFVSGAWSALATAAAGASQWVTSGSSISYTAGNVGIGTSNALSPLTVAGTVTGNYTATGSASNPFATNQAAGVIQLSNPASAGLGAVGINFTSGTFPVGEGYVLNIKESAGRGALAFGVSTSTSAYQEGLRINGNGVGIGTTLPKAALDINVTGSSSAVLVPRDTAANRPTGANGMIRYNTDSQAMEAYVNGAWMQFAMLASGASTPVTSSGPPVSANIYSYTATANYTPGFGTISNINNGVWPPNGTNANTNTSCVSLYSGVTASNQIITLDLGSVKTIGNVYATFDGDPNYERLGVAFSLDNVTWPSSLTMSGTNTGYNVYYVGLAASPTVTARYIRLTNGGTVNDNRYQTLCQFAVGP